MNIESIKKKLERLQSGRFGGGQSNNSKSIRWHAPKYDQNSDNTTVIRIVPVNGKDDPFYELYFYYDLGRTILSPKCLSEDAKDPVEEIRIKLFMEKTEESRALAKKLMPRFRPHVPVIVRGHEEDGVKFFGFGKESYQELLQYWLDPDYGDLSDPENGHDLKVIVMPPAQGQKFSKIQIRPAPKSSFLATKSVKGKNVYDAEAAAKIIESVPKIGDAYTIYSYEEIKGLLDTWLNAGGEVSKDYSSGDHSKNDAETEIPAEEDDPSIQEIVESLEERLKDT